MQPGTYVGEDRDGAPAALTLTAIGDGYGGTLHLGDRELPIWLSATPVGLTGTVHVPGEGSTWLMSAFLFGDTLHVDVGGTMLQLQREED